MLIIVPERNLYVPPRRIHRPEDPCGYQRAPGYEEIIVPRKAATNVGSTSNLNVAAGTTLDVTYSPTAGNLLVAWGKHEGTAGAMTFARSDGTESFSLGTLVDHTNNDLHARFGYVLSATGGTSITYRMTTTSKAFRSFHLWEFNAANPWTLDTQNTGQGSGATATSGNITTTGTDEVALGGYGEYSAITVTTPQINGVAAGGSIIMNSGNFTASWYRLLSATFAGGHANCSIGSTQDYICNIIAFKSAAAGGAANVGRNPFASPVFTSKVLS